MVEDTLISRIYQCSDCGDTFERHKDLKAHLRVHKRMRSILSEWTCLMNEARRGFPSDKPIAFALNS